MLQTELDEHGARSVEHGVGGVHATAQGLEHRLAAHRGGLHRGGGRGDAKEADDVEAPATGASHRARAPQRHHGSGAEHNRAAVDHNDPAVDDRTACDPAVHY